MTEFANPNTQLKTRLDAAVAMRVYSISAGRTLHWSRNTPYIFTILYLILIHLWNESTYKIHLLLQVWNEIIADNEQKLGKLGESKFIHMTVNGGECNVHAHSSLWMRPTRPDRYNAKMVYSVDCNGYGKLLLVIKSMAILSTWSTWLKYRKIPVTSWKHLIYNIIQ